MGGSQLLLIRLEVGLIKPHDVDKPAVGGNACRTESSSTHSSVLDDCPLAGRNLLSQLCVPCRLVVHGRLAGCLLAGLWDGHAQVGQLPADGQQMVDCRRQFWIADVAGQQGPAVQARRAPFLCVQEPGRAALDQGC